ncbi:PREDICTED: RBPJ-interacting and tubulin-associated protein [Chrysochloris asiatica]|uniref:RBPJ-interacting and tubulin-associated protein 1 n=1 Tax=Chrysochloris asiatica TaxID=185453 RepID=A0A9B0U802_CHRAS|nr:PREDICTED: RBPJ-interacting and tubulin-associated protein [Chrysochloris asiatica]
MRTLVELAISGMQALHRQYRGRGSHRLKARASYVDETLFGSPAGTRPTPPDFDPPWAETTNRSRSLSSGVSQANGKCENTPSWGDTPSLTPRKRNRYRLIGHTPSFCDESLFGSRPKGTSWEAPWIAKGDAAKLHALFWTPPTTPRGSHSPQPRETPLRAIHPASASKTEPRVAADCRKLPVNGLDTPDRLPRGRSQSLTHLDVPSMALPPTSAPHANGPALLGVTFRRPLLTPRAHSISVSVPATPRRGGVPQKPKPPWK